jgi:hypothetical protein
VADSRDGESRGGDGVRPEVIGAFRLALYHEQAADALRWPLRKWRWKAKELSRKHTSKAQKLYAKAAKLEARGLP